MKRIVGAFLLVFFINSCDDGDLKVDVIDFSDVTAQKCPDKNVVYKIKENEMLLLEIGETTAYENKETLPNTVREFDINASNKVTYRQYNGTVSASTICGSVPDATPTVIEEWRAISGKIQITTTAIKTVLSGNGTRITGFKHTINFKNINFQKPNGTQFYDNYPFGDYTTPEPTLPFTFDEELDKSTCANDNRIFNFLGGATFILDVSTNYLALFANSVTTAPRVRFINTTNKLSYRLYAGIVSNGFFCSLAPPATPALSQQWDALPSSADTNGIIEVTTTLLPIGSYQHTVRLKKVTLKRENSTFDLGDNYLLGSFVTAP